jgi:hypothetical protein
VLVHFADEFWQECANRVSVHVPSVPLHGHADRPGPAAPGNIIQSINQVSKNTPKRVDLLTENRDRAPFFGDLRIN